MNERNTSKQETLVGLIGFGLRTRSVVRNLLKQSEGKIAIGAVFDPSKEAIAACCEQFGSQVRVCSSVEELVAIPELSWVLIGSLNYLHAEHSIAALDAGKHVFCEKPLATTFEDCLAVKAAIERSRGMFSLGFVLRYSSHYRKIKEVLDSGAIGHIISFEFNETLDFNHGGHIFGGWRRFRELSGSHILEKCCHNLDLANWFLNSVPVKIASFGGKDFFVPRNERHIERLGKNKDGQAAYRTWPGDHPHSPFSPGATVIDNQVGIFEYANGTRGIFHTNCNSAILERRFLFCGEEGTLRADLISGSIELRRIGFETEVERLDTGAKGGHGGGDAVLARGLAESILHGANPEATAEDGIKSCIVAFSLNESMDEERIVDLLPLWERAGVEAGLLKHPNGESAGHGLQSPQAAIL